VEGAYPAFSSASCMYTRGRWMLSSSDNPRGEFGSVYHNTDADVSTTDSIPTQRHAGTATTQALASHAPPRTANVVSVRDTISYVDPFTRADVHCSWDSEESPTVHESWRSKTTHAQIALLRTCPY